MDDKTKQVLDKLCQDTMKSKDAMKELNMSREKIWELLDTYEYEPTKEEVLEAFSILKEAGEQLESTG